MKKKECFKCGARKPLNEFYKHPQMKDGRVNKCKECNRRDVKENRKANIEYYRDYDRERANLPHRIKARREYSKSDAGKAAHRKAHRKQRELYPIKRGARILVGNALRDGRIERPRCCETCGRQKRLHAHHDDYAKPLDVRWLCVGCHTKWHKENGPGLNGDR